MAWRGSPWPLLANGFEEDGNQNVDQELGEKHLHLKPGKKRCRIRSRSFSLSVFRLAGCFHPFSRRLKSTAGYVAVGEAKKEKPSHQQECRLKLTAGDNVEEAETKEDQPMRQELQEQSPSIQAQLRVENNSGGFSFRSGFRSLLKWSASTVRCSCCTSRHLTSASEVDIEGNEMNLDQVTSDNLSVIWLDGGNHAEELVDVSTFGNQGGDDSADFIATAPVQRTDRNATLGVVESVAYSAANPVECGVAPEEIINVNLGGPGERTEALGGLSLMGYERIVFSVCPPLPAVETDF